MEERLTLCSVVKERPRDQKRQFKAFSSKGNPGGVEIFVEEERPGERCTCYDVEEQ